ncbi:MAG: hypothetical protein RJB09_1539, partial [Pseudomonadota bacterium]
MKALSLAVLAFAVLSFGLGAAGKFDGGLLLGTAGLICAVSTFRSQKISSFLKIFVAIFATETVIFGLIVMAIKLGFWPEWARNYVIPDSLPLTVAVFGILVEAVSHLAVVRAITSIADRYFENDDMGSARIWPLARFMAKERRVAIAMVAFL